MSKIKNAYFDQIDNLPEQDEPYNEEMAMMAENQENLKNDPNYEAWLNGDS